MTTTNQPNWMAIAEDATSADRHQIIGTGMSRYDADAAATTAAEKHATETGHQLQPMSWAVNRSFTYCGGCRSSWLVNRGH